MEYYVLKRKVDGKISYEGVDPNKIAIKIPAGYCLKEYSLACMNVNDDKVTLSYFGNVKLFFDRIDGRSSENNKVESIEIPRADLESLLRRFATFKIEPKSPDKV